MNTPADHSEQIEDLVRLTQELVASPTDDSRAREWRAAVFAAGAATLVGVTAKLSSIPGEDTRDIKALREAIISETNRKNAQDLVLTLKYLDASTRKNTEDLISTITKLDSSATRLSWLSILLAIIGVLLAGIQVYQAFHH